MFGVGQQGDAKNKTHLLFQNHNLKFIVKSVILEHSARDDAQVLQIVHPFGTSTRYRCYRIKKKIISVSSAV